MEFIDLSPSETCDVSELTANFGEDIGLFNAVVKVIELSKRTAAVMAMI
jgi:hypothetical protein